MEITPQEITNIGEHPATSERVMPDTVIESAVSVNGLRRQLEGLHAVEEEWAASGVPLNPRHF